MTPDTAVGPQKILLVEDDKFIREMYRDFLVEKGYTVGTAGDGEEALAIVKTFQPDLIFLDIMMPKIDGLEVLKRLRTDPSYGCTNCRIVLLTNLGDNVVAEQVHEQIDGYAIKADITLADLVNIINSLKT